MSGSFRKPIWPKSASIPVTEPQRLTSGTLGSVSRSYFDPKDNVIYAGIRYPAHMASVAAIHVDTGKIEELKDIKGPALYYVTSLAWDARGRKLYYTTDNNDLRDLNVYDVETHHSERLIEGYSHRRSGLRCRGRFLWGVRHNNGLSSLVEFPAPYKEVKSRHDFDYGTDIFDIDVSPDGQYLTGAISDVSGRQKLVRFRIDDLRKGGSDAFEMLYDFEYNSPGNFVYSPDGRYLVRLVLLHRRVESVPLRFRDQEDGRDQQRRDRAVPSAAARRRIADRVRIYQQGIRSGARAHQAARRRQRGEVLRPGDAQQVSASCEAWKLPPPSTVNSENLITRAGAYNPLQNVQLISAYPIVQGYKDTAAVGMRAEFADRLRLAGVNVDASYSPDPSLPSNERAHVSFDAHMWDWKLTGYYNYADFYDLFGPTKVSRKGESLKLAHSQYLDLRYAAHALARLERGRLLRISIGSRSIRTLPPTISRICWTRT